SRRERAPEQRREQVLPNRSVIDLTQMPLTGQRHAGILASESIFIDVNRHSLPGCLCPTVPRLLIRYSPCKRNWSPRGGHRSLTRRHASLQKRDSLARRFAMSHGPLGSPTAPFTTISPIRMTCSLGCSIASTTPNDGRRALPWRLRLQSRTTS